MASAPVGGGREQEQGEAHGKSEVLVSGHVRVIRRMANGEWRMASGERQDEESLAYSPLAIRHSLFTVDIRPLFAGRDTPQTACREPRQPPGEGGNIHFNWRTARVGRFRLGLKMARPKTQDEKFDLTMANSGRKNSGGMRMTQGGGRLVLLSMASERMRASPALLPIPLVNAGKMPALLEVASERFRRRPAN
jgi:hypothetical protein